jgi:hypothetical protein
MADELKLKALRESLEYYRNQKKVKEAGKANPKPIAPGGPIVTIQKYSNVDDFFAKIKTIGGIASYIGIPGGNSRERTEMIEERLGKFHSPRTSRQRTKDHLVKRADRNVSSNAYLLRAFSDGSPRKNQPPRRVLEPAIHAPGNREKIADLIAKSVDAHSKGQKYKSKILLTRAGAKAAKAARDWFEDSRNNWAPNAPSTIIHKGSDTPGLDTTIMRSAITHIEKEVSS